MSRKRLITFSVLVGSTAGSYVPGLWGSGGFSMAGVFFGMLGGLAGIWVGYRYGA